MEKGKPVLRWVTILCVSMVMAGFGLNALAMGNQNKSGTKQQMGADLVTIDTLQRFGTLEYPVVRFEHDKHTKAVEGKCESCHLMTGNTITPKFKRQEDTTAAELKALYHENCIACHTNMTAAGKKSGPGSEQCRTCHAGAASSARTLISFDKSLHYRHLSSKAVPPLPGQKENCATCHAQDKPAERNLSFAENKDQAHEKCLSCHLDVKKASQETGPLECAGCHDATVRAGFKKVSNTPRLEAGQTDFMLLAAPLGQTTPASEQKLVNAVAFNHKVHEDKTESCSVCHHKALSRGVVACSSCHTQLGKEEGAFITTEQAMHRITAQSSCVGCHAQTQTRAQCAGCHAFLGNKGIKTNSSCAKCHVSMAINSAKSQDKLIRSETAAMVAAIRPKDDVALQVNEIPEIVEIGVLSKEFEASKFPHRKVVAKLMDGMKDNAMASYFHSSPNAVCSGCHHNSPASATPPNCVSCHSKNGDDQDGVKPVLKAAYHQQCMGCHREMGIEKPADTACAECHVAKK